jgi:hypothetical protein
MEAQVLRKEVRSGESAPPEDAAMGMKRTLPERSDKTFVLRSVSPQEWSHLCLFQASRHWGLS